MAEKYTSIAQLNIGNANPQIIVGNTLTPVLFDTNNDIDSLGNPIPIDSRYFNITLPSSDVQIVVPCKIKITGIATISGLVTTGVNQYGMALFRDIGDGGGFQLIRELIPLDDVLMTTGTGCIKYNFTIDVDFDFGVDPGHIFRFIVGRTSGTGDAEIASRGATMQINVIKLL